MDILGILSNNVIQTIGSSLFGLFIGGVGVWLWVKSGFSKAVREGGAMAGNKIGLFVYNVAIKNIKDANLKKKIIEDLDTAGNDIDKGWDLGIRGEEL